MTALADREPDALPAFLHRGAIQDAAVVLIGWGLLLAGAAERAPVADLLALLCKTHEAFMLAADEAELLAALENVEGAA